MLSQGKKAFGSASYFYLAILVAAGINILSSVYLSSRLEASMAKAAVRHPKSAKFDRSGIHMHVRHFDVPRRVAGNFDKAGVGGADLARLAASGEGAGQGSKSNDTADDTATYWELHVVNGRRDQLYVDLLIDSTDGRPRDPGTKDQLPELAQRKVTLDGKTHVIVTTYHRRRQLKPHSTTVVLCFWAEQGAQDNFEFHAEFSLGVDPFEPTDPQYSTNVSQAVRSAFSSRPVAALPVKVTTSRSSTVSNKPRAGPHTICNAPSGKMPLRWISRATASVRKLVALAGFTTAGTPANQFTATFSSIPHTGKLKAFICIATPSLGTSRW